jgi:cyclophilin family peptidyl-prolyl cis-trans isomerase
MNKIFFIVVISFVIIMFSIDFMNHKHRKKIEIMKNNKKKKKYRKRKRKRKKNIYNKEQNDMVYFEIKVGKYVLGKIIIKLFSNIVPKTCENFKVLCSNKKKPSYHNTIFHRVIKDFMIQCGDFTNFDGSGGYSIYGKKFKDENFKLKHNKAGLLSMANSGPNTNGSQFFITLKKTPHLDNKHVVFGKVIQGMNIVKKIGSVKTSENDVPIIDIVISKCGIYKKN